MYLIYSFAEASSTPHAFTCAVRHRIPKRESPISSVQSDPPWVISGETSVIGSDFMISLGAETHMSLFYSFEFRREGEVTSRMLPDAANSKDFLTSLSWARVSVQPSMLT
jgi:hypothetical protein